MQEMILNPTFSHSNSNCNYRQFFNLKKNDLLKKRWARAPMSPPLLLDTNMLPQAEWIVI